MEPNQPASSRTGERRAAQRRQMEPPTASVEFETERFEATGENISDTGVLLLTDSDVHVEVEVEGRTWSGRVVRVHAMPGGTTGWAVEFLAE